MKILHRGQSETRRVSRRWISWGYDFAINHFAVHGELGQVQIRKLAGELLQSYPESENENLGGLKLELFDFCFELVVLFASPRQLSSSLT